MLFGPQPREKDLKQLQVAKIEGKKAKQGEENLQLQALTHLPTKPAWLDGEAGPATPADKHGSHELGAHMVGRAGGALSKEMRDRRRMGRVLRNSNISKSSKKL